MAELFDCLCEKDALGKWFDKDERLDEKQRRRRGL